jgi:hypothetical protein
MSRDEHAPPRHDDKKREPVFVKKSCDHDNLVTTYGTPAWVYAGMALWTWSTILAIVFRHAGTTPVPVVIRTQVLPLLAPSLIWIVITCYGLRRLLRGRFPDKPYIWIADDRLTVRNRVSLDLGGITQIRYRWQKGRGGAVITGLHIYSADLAPDARITLSFANVTIKPVQAMDLLQSALRDRDITFEARPEPRAPSHDAAVRQAELRIGQRLLEKNPDARRTIEERIAQVPARLATLDALEAKVAANQASLADQIAASAARLGWPADGTALAPSRDWPDNPALIAPSDRTAWFRDRAIQMHLRLLALAENNRTQRDNITAQKANALVLRDQEQRTLDRYFPQQP